MLSWSGLVLDFYNFGIFNDWCLSLNLDRLVLDNLTQSNRLAFISECESTHLIKSVVFLKGNRHSDLNSANDFGKRFSELRLNFLNSLSLIVFLISNHDVLDDALLCNCVNVQDALITFGQNGLVA